MLQDKNVKGGLFEDDAFDFSELTNLGKKSGSILKDIKDLLPNIISDYQKLIFAQEGFIKGAAREFGAMREIGYAVRENLLATSASAAAVGVTNDELLNVQKGLMDGLKTSAVLSKEQLLDFATQAQIFGKTGKEVESTFASLIPKFANAGIQIGGVSSAMNQILKSANDYGVSVSAVYEVTQQNIEKLATYKFANGVAGLSDMAAQSTLVGVNLTKALENADKLLKFDVAQSTAVSLEQIMPGYLSKIGGVFGMQKMALDRESFLPSLAEYFKGSMKKDEQGNLVFSNEVYQRMSRTGELQAAETLAGGDLIQTLNRYFAIDQSKQTIREVEKDKGIDLSDRTIDILSTKVVRKEGGISFADLGYGKGEQRITEIASEDLLRFQKELETKKEMSTQEVAKASKSDAENLVNTMKATVSGITAELARVTDVNKFLKPVIDNLDVIFNTFQKLSGMKKIKIAGIDFIDTSSIGNSVKKNLGELGNTLKEFFTGKKGFIELMSDLEVTVRNALNLTLDKTSKIIPSYMETVNQGLKEGKYNTESFSLVKDIFKDLLPKEAYEQLDKITKDYQSNIKIIDNTKLSTEPATTQTPTTTASQLLKTDVDFKGKLDINVLSNNTNLSVETLTRLFQDPSIQSQIVKVITNDENFMRRIQGLPSIIR